MENYLTTKEAAATLRVSTATIARMIHAGRLPALKVGRGWLIQPDDLRALLERAAESSRPKPKPATPPRRAPILRIS